MNNFAESARVLRSHDRDRYVADLFAPEPARKHLFALHAFAAEIARIRTIVSEPSLGEIRLQWWRDVLISGDASGHPVATAVVETIARYRLPMAALDMMVEARIGDLYDDPLPAMADLEAYAGETEAALLQLSAIVLADGRDPGSADAAGHGGVAQTLVRVLIRLRNEPRHLGKLIPDQVLERHGVARGELVDPAADPRKVALFADLRTTARRHLDDALRSARAVPAETGPAFLPLAVTRARLDRLDRSATNPHAARDLPAWRRQWIMWRVARQARAARG
jgi:phytoene synthase